MTATISRPHRIVYDSDMIFFLERVATVLRRNDRDNVAWHYGLPSPDESIHPYHRRAYTRAVNCDYAALLRFLARRGVTLSDD